MTRALLLLGLLALAACNRQDSPERPAERTSYAGVAHSVDVIVAAEDAAQLPAGDADRE